MDRIKETLNELHQELSTGAPVDPETKQLLKQVSQDIQTLLEQAETSDVEESPATTTELATPEKESILDQMLGLTEEFEESHPELANIIGRIASALSRIGI